MLNEELDCRITAYGRKEAENDLGERTYHYVPLKTLWAGILPAGGREQNLPGGMVRAEITHKITIRAGALPELSTDLYFIFRGQRYDVKCFMPNYRKGDRIEIDCKMVVE